MSHTTLLTATVHVYPDQPLALKAVQGTFENCCSGIFYRPNVVKKATSSSSCVCD